MQDISFHHKTCPKLLKDERLDRRIFLHIFQNYLFVKKFEMSCQKMLPSSLSQITIIF